MANKSNTQNQINTQCVEELIMMIKMWQSKVNDVESTVVVASRYLTDEANLGGDACDEFKAGVEDIVKNVTAAKEKMEKFVSLCKQVNKTFDSVKVSTGAKFKDSQDRLIALRMQMRKVGNK